MPKFPIKKPGALPAVTEKVTEGVLDKLPEVDRRELMRGALGSLGDLSLAGKAVDVVAPALKSAGKIEDVTDFFNIPSMKKYMKKSYLDEYGAENQSIHFGFVEELLGFENKEVFDSLKRWVEEGIISSKEFDSLVKKHNLTPENAYDKFKQMDESEHLMLGIDENVPGTYPVEFQESFQAFNEQEIESFLDGVTKFEDLDKGLQEGLRYLISDMKMTLPEIRKVILDPD